MALTAVGHFHKILEFFHCRAAVDAIGCYPDSFLDAAGFAARHDRERRIQKNDFAAGPVSALEHDPCDLGVVCGIASPQVFLGIGFSEELHGAYVIRADAAVF